MIPQDLGKILTDVLGWLGWLGWVATAIQFLQLRHGPPQCDTKGSHIDCRNRQGRYKAEITIEPNYLIPSLFSFTLRVLGIGSIQTANIKPSLIELVYYDEDGDPDEVPTQEWHVDRKGVSVQRRFLAENRIQKLGITAPKGFTQEEIDSKISCRKVSDDQSGQVHTIVFELMNTNRIYQLRDYQLTLKDIPLDCSSGAFDK